MVPGGWQLASRSLAAAQLRDTSATSATPAPLQLRQDQLSWRRPTVQKIRAQHDRHQTQLAMAVPGRRRAGQPIRPTTLAALVHKLGVPTRTTPAQPRSDSTSWKCQQRSSLTPSATTHPATAAKIATHIGVTRSRYAAR
jgi:hypothetical protein